MVNKVFLIGRLGRDPEIRYTQSGMPVANMRIATDESYTDKDGNKVDKTEWHTVVVFQRQAENCANYLAKGSLVFVEGSLQTRKWQDQQGQDRYTTEIKAQRVQFLDRKGDNRQGDGYDDDRGQPRQGQAPRGGRGQYGGNAAGGKSSGGRQSAAREEEYPWGEGDQPGPSEGAGMDEVPF